MRSSLAMFVLAATLAAPVPARAQDEGSRQVSITERAIVPLTTRLRYTTMIILPPEEEIAEVLCGDRDYWVISAARNIAHIKPAKQAATTNLNLITTTGAVYSFLLREDQSNSPDLKLYVNVERNNVAPPRPLTAVTSDALVAELRDQLASEKASAARAKHEAEEAIATFRQQYPPRLQFPYRLPKYARPFLLRAAWHDGQFTYLKTDAHELPALYELKDGRAALVNFTVQHGLYVVPKVLENAYLVLGKKRVRVEMER